MSTSAESSVGRQGWMPVYSLGLYTITAYGTWAYGFGVLIESISADTGWSTTFLGSVYGAAMILTGLTAFWTGRLLDRFGSLVPFAIHALVSSGLLLAAFATTDRWLFAPLFALGAGLGGATGFYTMTTVIAARARPQNPDRAIAVLTMIGAFCSPIYLPLTAWLLTVWDWRTVARILVVAGIVGAVQAGLLVRVGVGRSSLRRRSASSPELAEAKPNAGADPGIVGAPTTIATPSALPRQALARALTNPAIRRILAVYFLAGAAASTVWVYQVPMMAGTGLALGLAGTIGGFRGFCQIFGRVGLTAAIERSGSTALLRAAYLATAVGSLALLVSGLGWLPDTTATKVALALVFAVFAGAGLGASSPLQAIHARLYFDPGDLGLLMGLQGAVLGVAGGLGPAAGAVIRDASGGWSLTVLLVIVGLSTSALLLQAPKAPPQPPDSDAEQSSGHSDPGRSGLPLSDLRPSTPKST